jgi:conjugative relaxase-like TrwC/TraI family protein
VTVRVTTLKGAGAGCYYTDHLPSYYLDGDEPPGRWWGKAAGNLGLQGEIASDAFHALLDGRNPVTGADVGRRMGETSVRGFDVTFSAPKSVSVLFGLGDEAIRDQVVEAHEAGVAAVLAWIEDHSHTRLRVHGHVMNVDADGIVVGMFRQHTSRRLDPQLHTHAVIANRVLAPDGRWLALDARTIKLDQRTLSALYHVCIRAELTCRLGVRWAEPKHGIAEIADIPEEVLAEFSQRTSDMDQRLEVKLGRFRRNLGRDPTPEERWRLEREAVIDSRPAKSHGISHGDLYAEWEHRVRELGLDPVRVVRSAIGRQRTFVRVDPTLMTAQALGALQSSQSSWRTAEVLRELAASFPTTVPVVASELTGWLETLAERTIEEQCVELQPPIAPGMPIRRDGRPVTEAAAERRLTCQAILEEEQRLITWAERRLAQPASLGSIDGHGLDLAQIKVAATVAGHRDLELVEGPAGTGKTTALAAAVTSLQDQDRTVFGVAPTAAAAQVLASETGMPADTLDKLLVEHSVAERPPLPEYDLARGSTLVVDEAGTASTPTLARLADLADEKAWRVVLVGDPRQFSAVGRGGMFAYLIQRHGAIELDQVHRFAHDWERHASLQLRSGDPDALIRYDRHGRIHGGTVSEMESAIVDAWRAARGRGETVALMANSNQAIARLNRLAQMTRFVDGEISFQKKGALRLGDQVVCVGDEVVTRCNDRARRTDQGIMVKNRDRWTVQAIHPDRSITLTGPSGTIRLPSYYTTKHLTLGYAQTSHASQGRTVDTGLLLVDAPTDLAGIYTPMTRGRDGNHAYVVIEDHQMAIDVLTQAMSRDWIDQPAVVRQLQSDHERSGKPMNPDHGFRTDGLTESEMREMAAQKARALRREQSVYLGVDR